MSAEPGGCPENPYPTRTARTVARTAADVLAIVPHTLGYWPCRSVAILTAAGSGLGPCLRIELPSMERFTDPEWVAAWTTQLSAVLEYDTVGQRMYVVCYGQPPSASRVSGNRADDRAAPGACGGSQFADDETGRTALQEHALAVLRAIDEAGTLSGHALQDGWCVSGESWWPVVDPARLRSVGEILDSAVYAAMVCSGSVVGPDPIEEPAEEVRGLFAGAGGFRQPETAGYEWRLEYLEQWHRVLGTGRGRMPGLPRDSRMLTDLMLGMADPLGCELILAMVLTGDPAASREAWAETAHAAGGAEMPGVLQIAHVMSGIWRGRPDWRRLDRCVVVLQELIPMARAMLAGVSGSAQGLPPEGVGGDDGRTFLPTMLAGLWLALGHAEHFRARGSLVERYVAEAEQVAPWHPGIERLRQLAASRPVPVWATDPVTAWRRSAPAPWGDGPHEERI
ncbi:DUF4192 family protein [Kocuria coralli]|uniref:DUF4192 family protein n=1 Tax=Kocuria coralli TaxID=1461025 RepID=A0A5J5KV24_9MICC|nr:DUF4192 family protein [Kocuria coralli]KAA9393424.1 DUF4192 family protein [Kocuria coralli]